MVVLCMKRRKMEPVGLWGIMLDENSILRDPRNIIRQRITAGRDTWIFNAPLQRGHLGRGRERGYRTRQCFDNSGDSLAPRFFSHPQPCNSKWCVLHSRVRCNIATCIRRVLHTGNYKWTKPSCRPTLPRCQIEWWHARHTTLSPPPRFLPPTTHTWSSSPFLFRSVSFIRDSWRTVIIVK